MNNSPFFQTQKTAAYGTSVRLLYDREADILESIDCVLSLSEIYQRVEFE